MNNKLPVLLSVALSLGVTVAHAEGDRKGGAPGDDFRATAMDYQDNADKMGAKAAGASPEAAGLYRRISAVYGEMAQIKHNAGTLADAGRWDDISWDRYHELAGERDRLWSAIGALEHGGKKKRY